MDGRCWSGSSKQAGIFTQCLANVADSSLLPASLTASTTLPTLTVSVRTISLPKADGFCPSAAAASVISKTVKDELVCRMAERCTKLLKEQETHSSERNVTPETQGDNYEVQSNELKETKRHALLHSFGSHKGYGTAQHIQLLQESYQDDPMPCTPVAVGKTTKSGNNRDRTSNKNHRANSHVHQPTWRGGPHPFLHRLSFLRNIVNLNSNGPHDGMNGMEGHNNPDTTGGTWSGESDRSYPEAGVDDQTSEARTEFMQLRNIMYSNAIKPDPRDEREGGSVPAGTRKEHDAREDEKSGRPCDAIMVFHYDDSTF